jgi:cysteine desulfurase
MLRRRVRDRVAPIVRGGAQERDLRAGTENVAGIVGFGAACTLAPVDGVRTGLLRDRLAAGILGGVDHAAVTAHGVRRSPGILHMSFKGIAAEELLILLDDAEVASSAGSACASGALDPSHVLLAMGWSEADTRTAMRFSLGRQTTEGEIDRAIGAITAAVGRLVGREVA